MWSFNQNQGANNNQNSGLGWNVNSGNTAGGKNGEIAQQMAVSIIDSSSCLGDFNPAGASNFGWNLGAPNAAQMPMPQPPSPRYDSRSDSDPGVDESFTAKEAGNQSFAHYIVKWVSFMFIYIFIVYEFPWFTGLSRFSPVESHFALNIELTLSHIHKRSFAMGAQHKITSCAF